MRSVQTGTWFPSTEDIRVRVHHCVRALACFAIGLAISNDSCGGDLKPYPLPPEARTGIEKLAASSDLLVLGEIHGTQEVPQLVAGLLAPLSELGYHMLALEVPNNQQAAVLAWTRRETKKIPDFFANPNGDGRGNAQLLALARIAAAPPFQWQIICFDESESILEEKARLALTQKKQTEKAKGSELTVDDEMFALWRERDATMAAKPNRSSRPRRFWRSAATCMLGSKMTCAIRCSPSSGLRSQRS
jgi:hypothetical protein